MYFFSLLFSLLFRQALCGSTVNAPTLDSRTVTLSTTDIVQPGMKRRVSGEGLPYPKRPGRRGDLILDYEVKFPERLSQSARDTIAQVLPWSWWRQKDLLGLISLNCQLFFCFFSLIMWSFKYASCVFTVNHSVKSSMGACENVNITSFGVNAWLTE